MTTNLTVTGAKKYIKYNYGRESFTIDVSCLVKACKKVAKDNGVKPLDLFYLMIENKPIEGGYTHSYGFHTGTGRYLIETTGNTYYQFEYSKRN